MMCKELVNDALKQMPITSEPHDLLPVIKPTLKQRLNDLFRDVTSMEAVATMFVVVHGNGFDDHVAVDVDIPAPAIAHLRKAASNRCNLVGDVTVARVLLEHTAWDVAVEVRHVSPGFAGFFLVEGLPSFIIVAV